MTILLKAAAALLFAAGFYTAGWGPIVFELLQGGEPLPHSTTRAGNISQVWVGVAALRVAGALLATVGAVLWAFASRNWGPAHRALAGGLIFTAVITALQQQALWQGITGFVVAGVLAVAAIFVILAGRRG